MSGVWILNTSPEHWRACVEGPDDVDVHGEELCKEEEMALHGLKEGEPRGREKLGKLREGDLMLARQTKDEEGVGKTGVRGIWEFYDHRRVDSQDEVPEDWGGTYSHFLYCRPLTLEVSESSMYEEDWSSIEAGDFVYQVMTGQTMLNLDGYRRSKERYLEELLNHPHFDDEETQRRLQQE